MIGTEKMSTPIIPFNLLIDIDVGLIRLINKNYHNEDIFYKGIMEAPIDQLVYFLYTRKDENPLYILSDIDKYTLDVYYKQFMENEYENICNLSIKTNLFNAIGLFNESEGIKPYVLCNNDIEFDIMKEICKDYPNITILEDKLDSLDISLFDPIYFKYYKDTLKLATKMKAKNIYVANYPFNYSDYDNNVLDENISEYIMIRNQCTIVDIYKLNEEIIPKG